MDRTDKHTHWITVGVLIMVLLMTTLASPASALPQLRVSDNGRFLQTVEGKPFFYLGDTAWELFHRLNREAAIRYLDKRAAQGFNVI